MKFLLCRKCKDVIKLIWRPRQCSCGECVALVSDGDEGVAHFAGDGLPLELSDISVSSLLSCKPNGNRDRLVLNVVSQAETSRARSSWNPRSSRGHKLLERKPRARRTSPKHPESEFAKHK